MPDDAGKPAVPLREVPGFVGFSTARVLGWIAAAMTLVALPVLVYDLTGSAGTTALLATVETLPYLILGLLAGALADRVPRRRLLIVTTSCSALALTVLVVAALADALSVPLVFAVALTVASLNVFADAACFGALPALVGRAALARAQGLLTTIGTVALVGAPALAGVLIGLAGTTTVLAVEAGTFAVSVLLYGGLPLREVVVDRSTRLLDGIAEGLRFVRDHPLVRALTVLGIAVSSAGGVILGLQVVLAVEELAIPTDDPRIGLLYTAAAVGSAVAGLLVGRAQARWSAGSVAVTGYALGWVLVLAVAVAPNLALALVALTLWGATSTLVIVNGIVARTIVTPDGLQGRVNTTARMVAWGGQPVGAAAGAGLAELLGTRWAIGIVGSSLLIAAAVGVGIGLPGTGTDQEGNPA